MLALAAKTWKQRACSPRIITRTHSQASLPPSPRVSVMTASIPTKPLYQHDEGLRRLSTIVTGCQPLSSLSVEERALFKHHNDSDHVVQTEETIMYAQGGGQPFDTGTMMTSKATDLIVFKVTAVRSAGGGRILHCGSFASATSMFTVGNKIEQAVDAERRALNSRIHTGGHIVGLAVRHLASSIPDAIELKAQHYPDSAFVEFRGHIDGKHKEAIERKAIEFVDRALPVKVYFLEEPELRDFCAMVPDAVALPKGELIRAVDIEGAGAYPCGGTHVRDTSLVGKISIRKISRSKGVSKISYSIEP